MFFTEEKTLTLNPEHREISWVIERPSQLPLLLLYLVKKGMLLLLLPLACLVPDF